MLHTVRTTSPYHFTNAMDKYADLADYIRNVMAERNLSTYAVARGSGNVINANTITRILNGDIKEAKLSTLEAIAKGLGVPAIELFRIAHLGKKKAQAQKREIWIEAFGGEHLPANDVAEIEATIEFLIQQKMRMRQEEAIDRAIAEQYADDETLIDPETANIIESNKDN